MAAVRSTNSIKNQQSQTVVGTNRVQSEVPSDLVAEFSNLLEQIADRLSVESDSELLQAPAALPKLPPSQAHTKPTNETLRQESDGSRNEAAPDTVHTEDEGEDATQNSSDSAEPHATEEAPRESNADEVATDKDTQEQSSDVAVALGAAGMQDTKPVEAQTPSEHAVDASAVNDQLSELAPVTLEASPTENANEAKAEDVHAAVTTEATITEPAIPSTATQDEGIAARISAEVEAKHAEHLDTPKHNDRAASLPEQFAQHVVRRHEINADLQNSEAAITRLRLAPDVAAALERVAQQLPAPTPDMVPTAIKFALDRDALVATLSLRPVLEHANRVQEALKSGITNQQPFALDGGSNKASARSNSEMSARAPRAAIRVTFEHALEKVESAVREAARAKDGSSLTFRLDPPQLGSLKVDVSLREGVLHARLIPETAQVAQLLRERAHELQQSLRKLGLDVDSVSVSVGGEQSFASTEGGSESANLNGNQGRSAERETAGAHAFSSHAQVAGAVTVGAGIDHWVA